MELFIRIKDGQPFEHPIFGDNFRQAFPDVDVNNLPPEFARFERVDPPVWGPYDKNPHSIYERGADGVYRDTWHCEKMTDAEIKEKQESTKKWWAESAGTPKSWIFNSETCLFEAPVPYPTDGKNYRWDEPSLSWVEPKEVA